jgi:hypothetical protein
MLGEFKAISGQLLKDVCLNTYQTLDYIVKLANDNGITDLNYLCKTGDKFIFNPELVVNIATLREIEIKDKKYLITETPDPVDFGLNYN